MAVNNEVEMEEFTEEIKGEIISLYIKYPFLVPSHHYRKWEGVIYSQGKRFHILINTPNYPALEGHSLFCCQKLIPCQQGQSQVTWRCDSLLSLLEDVSALLVADDSLPSSCEPVDLDDLHSLARIVDDVERFVERENVVAVDDRHAWIKLRYIDSSGQQNLITVRLDKKYPESLLRIIDADLPNEILSRFSQVRRLGDLYSNFKETVESLMPFWRMTEELAQESWVIEPIEASKKDLHRRIFLSDNLSVQLTFSPLKVDEMPDIKFLGSLGAVSHARDTYQRNLQDTGWWSEAGIVANLCRLLCLDSLPKQADKEAARTDAVEQDDNDCAICYETSTDSETFPAKWCSNKNCSGRFHHSCLMEWLNSVATSKSSFDHISGPCPHCDEKIFCPIKLK